MNRLLDEEDERRNQEKFLAQETLMPKFKNLKTNYQVWQLLSSRLTLTYLTEHSVLLSKMSVSLVKVVVLLAWHLVLVALLLVLISLGQLL
jgi:hypothetical protein